MTEELPPFRQSHEDMRAASRRKLEGPGAGSAVAASGGVDLPGGVSADIAVTSPPPREPFPGEREPDTLVGTQPGAVGGVGFGIDLPPSDPAIMTDAKTAEEHRREGGGGGQNMPN